MGLHQSHLCPGRVMAEWMPMFQIKSFSKIAPSINKIEIFAPEIVSKWLPGQFIILRIDEKGERIPLTVYQVDKEQSLLSVIFQEVGKTTRKLATLKEGDCLTDLIGPLGHPLEVKDYGKVVCIGGGVGTAEIYPDAKALKEANCHLISILGARNKDLLILKGEMEKISDEAIITTDDGSQGRRGLVTDALKEVLDKDTVDMVIAIGPVIMMREVAKLTEPYKVKTIVSLNSIMVDGTGMCGSCRVTVGGKTRFACVDGPHFDGHLVDFDELLIRNSRFLEEEKISLALLRT